MNRKSERRHLWWLQIDKTLWSPWFIQKYLSALRAKTHSVEIIMCSTAYRYGDEKVTLYTGIRVIQLNERPTCSYTYIYPPRLCLRVYNDIQVTAPPVEMAEEPLSCGNKKGDSVVMETIHAFVYSPPITVLSPQS